MIIRISIVSDKVLFRNQSFSPLLTQDVTFSSKTAHKYAALRLLLYNFFMTYCFIKTVHNCTALLRRATADLHLPRRKSVRSPQVSFKREIPPGKPQERDPDSGFPRGNIPGLDLFWPPGSEFKIPVEYEPSKLFFKLSIDKIRINYDYLFFFTLIRSLWTRIHYTISCCL